MDLPRFTPPQCNALGVLIEGGELSGRQLHQKLADRGDKKTGPNFYQFMGRLETSGYVESRFETKVIDGQTFREKYYKITSSGEQTLTSALAWYGELNARTRENHQRDDLTNAAVNATPEAQAVRSADEASPLKDFRSRVVDTSISDARGVKLR